MLASSTALVIDPFDWPENNVHMNKGDKRAMKALLDLQSNERKPSSPAAAGSIKLSEFMIKIPNHKTKTLIDKKLETLKWHKGFKIQYHP